MVKVNPQTNEITLTRGDTLRVKFVAKSKDGTPYVYKTGDRLDFFAKKENATGDAEIMEEIDTATGELVLSAEKTKAMKANKYVYDIQLTKANGDVDTIINMASITIKNEVA